MTNWGKCVRNCWRPVLLDTCCPEWSVSCTYSFPLVKCRVIPHLNHDSLLAYKSSNSPSQTAWNTYWQSRRSNTKLVRVSTRTKLKVVDCSVFSLPFSLKRGFSNCSTRTTNGTPKRYLHGLNENLAIKKGMKIFDQEWNMNYHNLMFLGPCIVILTSM